MKYVLFTLSFICMISGSLFLPAMILFALFFYLAYLQDRKTDSFPKATRRAAVVHLVCAVISFLATITEEHMVSWASILCIISLIVVLILLKRIPDKPQAPRL